MNCGLITSVFVDQKNLKIIWKFSLSQYRCHKTPIDVENCGKSALNSNHRKQNFTVITNWGGGDYQLRSALAAKQIWVAVITLPTQCNVSLNFKILSNLGFLSNCDLFTKKGEGHNQQKLKFHFTDNFNLFGTILTRRLNLSFACRNKIVYWENNIWKSLMKQACVSCQ